MLHTIFDVHAAKDAAKKQCEATSLLCKQARLPPRPLLHHKQGVARAKAGGASTTKQNKIPIDT